MPRQGDVYEGTKIEPQFASAKQRRVALNHTTFFQGSYPAPTCSGGNTNVIRKRLVAYTAILLQSLKNANVSPIHSSIQLLFDLCFPNIAFGERIFRSIGEFWYILKANFPILRIKLQPAFLPASKHEQL